jgi:hypothetical protein
MLDGLYRGLPRRGMRVVSNRGVLMRDVLPTSGLWP